METYSVIKTGKRTPGEDDWDAAEKAVIGCSPWAEKYPAKYDSYAKLIETEDGIFVRMASFEKDPVRMVRDDRGEIWTDSCLEFFFMPDSRTGIYYNFECNANRAMLAGRGTGRKNRERVTPMSGSAEFFSINAEIYDDFWQVTYRIPKPFVGVICEPRGNFYKCQESVPERMHFQCWSNISSEKPDFHKPEFFGRIVF